MRVALDMGDMPLGLAVLDYHEIVGTRPAIEETVGMLVQIHSNDLYNYLWSIIGAI